MAYDRAERHAGWRRGVVEGFDEAMALVRDLPPEASTADVLKVLALHREVWQKVFGAWEMSADDPASQAPWQEG